MKQGFEKEVLYADVCFVEDPLNFSVGEVRHAKRYQFKTHVETLLKYQVVSIVSLAGELNFGIFMGYSEKNPQINNHALLVNKIDVDGAKRTLKEIEETNKEQLKTRIAETMKQRMESPFILDLLCQIDVGLKADLEKYEKLMGKKYTVEDFQAYNKAPF